ncbi:MAG: hypothetical protein AAFS10_08400, partial [Myxococcota bacterium]
MKPGTRIDAMDLALLVGVTAASLGIGISCNGTGGGFDCTAQTTNYDTATANTGLLVDTVPVDGPFPMAMVLSQDGVNNLLATVLDREFQSVTIEDSGYSIRIKPSLPIIQLENFTDCPTCVLANMDLDIERVEVFGINLGSATAVTTIGLPVSMQAKNNTTTGLMAEMNNATIRNLDLNLSGFSLSDVPLLQDLVTDWATSYVQTEFGATELVELDSWQVSDDVLLAARGPVIFPEQRTILLGLHTNLSLPGTASLQQQATLPQNTQMGLQFHPDLLLGMVQRLMTEDTIPTDYDEQGNFTGGGDHRISMSAMTASETGAGLRTDFRIWRTGGGLCGFADVSSTLAAQISGDDVRFTAQDFEITGGDGIGQFLDQSQWLAGDFIESMTRNIELTVNYKEMGFEGEEKEIVPKANALTIDGSGLSVFLDLGIQDKAT